MSVLNKVRAVFETNVFGVLAVTQAMLPLLREAPEARIVNVSSGVGSLTMNADPAYPGRSIFGPVYPASKTALNAMTLAMAIELEPRGSRSTPSPRASPRRTSTTMRARRLSRRAPARRCVLRCSARTARQVRSRTQNSERSRGDVVSSA